jgi:hypothetical protein
LSKSGITAVNVNYKGTNYVGYAVTGILADSSVVFGSEKSDSNAADTITDVYLINSAGYTIGKATQETVEQGAVIASKSVPEVTVTSIDFDSYNGATQTFSADGLYKVINNSDGTTSYVYVVNAGTIDQKLYYADVDGYIEADYKSAPFTTAPTATSGYYAEPKALSVDAKSVSGGSSDYTYYVKFTSHTSPSDEELNTVAYALDDGTLSANAVAVKYEIYRASADQTIQSSGTKVLKLTQVNSISSDLKFTLSDDFISRTKLKGSDNIRVFALNEDETIKKDGLTTYGLVALGESALGDSFTFSTRDFTESVLIFDGFADESNNDGVSETTTTAAAATTASTTAATSPKTGDVAPIAALAVVMMGACGAMVVASKKRA